MVRGFVSNAEVELRTYREPRFQGTSLSGYSYRSAAIGSIRIARVAGDNLAAKDMVAAAKRLEDFGCDFVIHHISYDQRRGLAAAGRRYPSRLDQLREVAVAVGVPVQAVGGLSIEQAIRTPEFGAPLVVLGAPLTIDADSFKTASGNLEDVLRLICDSVRVYCD